MNFVDIFSDSFMSELKLYTVHPSDIKIMNQLDVRKYNAVVAGGAALRWYQNLPVDSHDIDVWFNDESSMSEIEKHIARKYTLKFSSENAQTYEINIDNKEYRVQLIKPKSNQNLPVQELIESFDITVCQIATDGVKWWISDSFMRDLLDRRLTFTKYTPKTVRRLVKYWTYGFTPDSKTLETITTDPQIMWNYESSNSDDYDNII